MSTKCFEGILFISGLKAIENYACNVTLKDKKGAKNCSLLRLKHSRADCEKFFPSLRRRGHSLHTNTSTFLDTPGGRMGKPIAALIIINRLTKRTKR